MTSPGEPSNVARQVLVQEGENENGNCMMLTQPTVNPPQFRQLTRNPRRMNPRPAGRGPADLTSSALEKQTDSAMAKVYFGPEYTYRTRRINTRDTFIVPSTHTRYALADARIHSNRVSPRAGHSMRFSLHTYQHTNTGTTDTGEQ